MPARQICVWSTIQHVLWRVLAATATREDALVEQTPAVSCSGLQPIRAPGRVVAIGDLHGDLGAARRASQTAKVIDEADHWIVGNGVVAQTGAVLDSVDEERHLLKWLERLAGIAGDGGGALHRVQETTRS